MFQKKRLSCAVTNPCVRPAPSTHPDRLPYNTGENHAVRRRGAPRGSHDARGRGAVPWRHRACRQAHIVIHTTLTTVPTRGELTVDFYGEKPCNGKEAIVRVPTTPDRQICRKPDTGQSVHITSDPGRNTDSPQLNLDLRAQWTTKLLCCGGILIEGKIKENIGYTLFYGKDFHLEHLKH
ncbi:unnamed protein product [Leptosia nina]|uniref:Uncharacterized protein n=1 Tax=Leptosia nina TaxID=320188 RepID=A0AAV1JKZ0_9NEOP